MFLSNIKTVVLVTLALMLFSCQNESSTTSESRSTKVVAQNKMVEVEQIKNSIFAKHFDAKEQGAILKIKETFDNKIHMNRKGETVKDSYEYHCWKLRSDLLQNNPISLNYPYNSNFTLTKDMTQDLSSIWTDKCGFKKEDEVINFFCIDVQQKVMDYFTALSEENGVIHYYTKSYKENKNFTPDEVKQLVMTSVEEMDFSRIDHQLFHMIFHLSLNDEQQASKKLASL